MTKSLSRLQNLFDAGVLAVRGDQATRGALAGFDRGSVYLIAIGKAAPAMTMGALDVLGDAMVEGLVISKYDHIEADLYQNPRLHCIETAHPVPDEQSLAAGTMLIEFVTALPDDAELLFLVSGGASALVEALPAHLTLSDLQRVNEYLLAEGLDIGSMNQVRKTLSLTKGGRLASCLSNQHTTQLLISDVPGDVLQAIGSGMLVPPDGKGGEPAFFVNLPDWLSAMQSTVAAPEPDDAVWSTITSRIIASNAIAREAVASAAEAQGLPVQQIHGDLNGDVPVVAGRIAELLADEKTDDGIYIWGGETTVVLPDNPGRGGRNQHLALELAWQLSCRSEKNLVWQAICCGTDG